MAVQISGNDITVPRDGSFTRNVTIGGTLTYEDVTNIDSVGLVTARTGIEIGARPGVAASISVDGNMIVSGISTFGGVVNASSDIKVGSGVTIGKDGDIFATGITTMNQIKITTGANAFETSANVFKGASGQKGVYLRSALSAEDTPSYSSVDDTNTGIFLPGSDVFGVTTGGSERLRIDSSGRVLISHTASRTVGTKTGQIQVIESVNNAAISIIQTNNAASAPFLCFGKTRSANDTGSTIVQNGDSLGQILFAGADGSDVDSTAALITAKVDGTPGSNDMPGKLVFATTADGASTATPAMEINSVGIVTCRNIPSFLIHIGSENTVGSNAIIISEDNGFTLSATGRNDHNFGNHFNEADGKFTAPVEGLYFFGYSIMRSSTSGSGAVDIRIMKNGGVNSLYSRNYQGSYQVNFQAEGNTTIARLKKDDYIQFRIGANMSVHNDDSYFYGYLIG